MRCGPTGSSLISSAKAERSLGISGVGKRRAAQQSLIDQEKALLDQQEKALSIEETRARDARVNAVQARVIQRNQMLQRFFGARGGRSLSMRV